MAMSVAVLFPLATLERPVIEMIKPTHASQSQEACCPIVELRQYTLHPGKRDDLINLFDREFIETQEAVGMRIVGQFRDLNDPNRFVWLRGFRDMPSRAQALADFYGGPVWKTHREAANATMIDSTNVLLLRPARPGSGFLPGDRPSSGANTKRTGLVVATIYYFEAPVTGDFIAFFEGRLKPVLEDTGASVLAYFVTEASANTFPKLPVREGENVFVWFSRFRDQSAYEDHEARLSRLQRWRSELSQDLKRRLKRQPEVLKLSRTERSQLRG
jgi:quinol monooxygenase YgiN